MVLREAFGINPKRVAKLRKGQTVEDQKTDSKDPRSTGRIEEPVIDMRGSQFQAFGDLISASLGRVDKRFDPEPCGGEVEETYEGQDGLVVSGRDTAHLLEFVEHALDAVTVLVTPPVSVLWSAAAFA